MSTTELDAEQLGRRKKTTWLLAVGGATLLLPLAGVAYLHWNEAHAPTGPGDHSDVFERREGMAEPLKPSQTVVPNVMTAANAAKAPSSLDFIRAGDDYRAAVAAPVVASTVAAAAPATATAASPAAAAKKKPAAAASTKKTFTMPKLQPTRGFTNFSQGAALPAPGAANAAAASGANSQTTQQMLQNLPPGAQNNPDIQKYLQSQQGK